MSAALMTAAYRLVQGNSESVVTLPELTVIKRRISACKTVAKRLGVPSLFIMDSERSNEYAVVRKNKAIARLISLPRWS